MHRVTPLEAVGLKPLRRGLRQCWGAIAGDGYSPPSQWGTSSLALLHPRFAPKLWAGRRPRDPRAIVTLLPNRDPAPRDEGYSVRVTRGHDFRGRRLTYDSHVGTDLSVPVGTEVRAPAPGRVVVVANHMQRGGLKVAIDHGGGLLTTLNHLSRALVSVGQRVTRGERVGLSGMSGVDGLLFCPWLPPHVHVNVLLGGEAVDPFATAGEVSLWTDHNDPKPHTGAADEPIAPTDWDRTAVDETIASCRDPELKASLQRIGDDDHRAAALTVERLFRFHAFASTPPLTREPPPRAPRLSLPFGAEVPGVRFVDVGVG